MERILIADDEPGIVVGLEFLFRTAGYDVQTVADGREVLARVHSYRPALLVLDLMLPAKSGYEICRELRAAPQTQSVLIVMLTARGMRAEIESGLAAGANAYVTKPFATRELLQVVRGLLQR